MYNLMIHFYIIHKFKKCLDLLKILNLQSTIAKVTHFKLI